MYVRGRGGGGGPLFFLSLSLFSKVWRNTEESEEKYGRVEVNIDDTLPHRSTTHDWGEDISLI